MYKLAFVVLSSFSLVASAIEDNRRPFFNIAHMVNSIPEIDRYLRRGANAIEADVTFSSNGTVLRVFHGLPCDCYRRCMAKTRFSTYLSYLRKLKASGEKRLVLLMLDLKLDELESSPELLRYAGGDLYRKLVEYLWLGISEKNRLNVLVSIQRVEQEDFFKGFLNEMEERRELPYRTKISFDVGMNSAPDRIASMYSSLGVKGGMWQGDGITNCLVELRPEDRLREVLKMRDSPSGYVDKVYFWTVDMSHSMARILEMGVDALISNHPERVLRLINEKYSMYRLADATDSPWRKIIFNSSTVTPSREVGLGISHTIDNFSELASQASSYLWSFFPIPRGH